MLHVRRVTFWSWLLIVLAVASLAFAATPPAHANSNCTDGSNVPCAYAIAIGIWHSGAIDLSCGYASSEIAENGGPGSTAAEATSPPDTGSCGDPYPFDPSFASADLATGQLKAYTHSFANTGLGSTGASADFADTVTLTPPPGYTASTIPVTLTLASDATVSGSSYAQFSLQAQLNPYQSVAGFYCLATPSSGWACPDNSANSTVTLSFNLATYNGQYTFTVNGQLEIGAKADGIANAADTGQLSLQLPPGVTYTSSSGVLLSQAPKPADTTAPTVSITAHPANPTSQTSASFSFSATDPDNAASDLTFACKLDGGSFAPCASPQSYAGPLADGTHTFAVHASDPAGNTSADATYTWLVDTTPPRITPTVSGTQGSNGWYTSNVSVSWNVADPESGIANSTGCGPATVSSDTTGTTFTCTATNGAGLSTTASVTVKRDATPPACTVSASPSSVWPPNHKAVPVTLTVTVNDATAGPGPLTFVSQTASGAADDISGFDHLPAPALSADGKTATYTITGEVIANKDESYSVRYSATDQAGNTTACPPATISVPHDQGQ